MYTIWVKKHVLFCSPFSVFGRNNNPKQYENTRTYNEVPNNDKIITVTPHAAYYDKSPVTAQPNSINLGTFKDPKWGISQVLATTYLPNVWDLNSKDSTLQGQDKVKTKEVNLTIDKKSEEKLTNEFEISEEDINRIFKYNEITTDSSDYTTESTTEYESTVSTYKFIFVFLWLTKARNFILSSRSNLLFLSTSLLRAFVFWIYPKDSISYIKIVTTFSHFFNFRLKMHIAPKFILTWIN